jgi:mono/diheme cytochrome c family protein
MRVRLTVSRGLLLLAFAFYLTTVTLVAATAPVQDTHPALPEGEGRDVMIRVCSKCHDPELAADQQYDEAGWKSLVDQMAAKGADATDAEYEQIVKYLAKAFPPR